jgi:hypothetical protein
MNENADYESIREQKEIEELCGEKLEDMGLEEHFEETLCTCRIDALDKEAIDDTENV